MRDGSIVDPLLAGCDAVVSALGVSRATPGVRPSDGLRALLEGMRRHNVRRYVGISGAALDLPGDRRPLGDRIISAIVRRLIAGVIADKRQELEVLGAASDIVWTLARPPRIVAGSVGEARSSLVTAPSMKIGQADVAAFLLDQLDDEQFAFKAPFIAS